MKRLTILIALLLAALFVTACSDGNSDAPAQGQVHPEGWVTAHDESALDDPDGCAVCHGADLAGSGDAVSCFSCHTGGSPLEFAECTSCHNTPPDSANPAGDERPNRGEGHFTHDALPAFSGQDDCSACHEGAGANTPQHFDFEEPADVSLLEVYDAKDSTSSYDAEFMTCSAVSCHGGQESPSWFQTLTVEDDCEVCHELGDASQTPQFNSYFSGRHESHIEFFGFSCQVCHDQDELGRQESPNHFSGLDTPEFEQDPSTTIRDFIGYDPEAPSCMTNTGACHGGEERSWL